MQALKHRFSRIIIYLIYNKITNNIKHQILKVKNKKEIISDLELLPVTKFTQHHFLANLK